MYESTGIEVPHCQAMLMALREGTVLTDEHGNLFMRSDREHKTYGPYFHLLFRCNLWPSGFKPVDRYRNAEAFGGRRLFLARKVGA